MKKSFSAEVKEHILSQRIRKKCCIHALADGRAAGASDDPSETVLRGYRGLVCGDCLSYFVAGLFVAFGSVTDPEKGYHLDFSLPDDAVADAVEKVLCDAGFSPKRTHRLGKTVLYFKSSTTIEDLLGYMGAASGAFRVMNNKIIKEMRENTNRQVNCDAANIAKSLSASEKQLRMIEKLRESGRFDLLTGDLKETCEMRAKYPDASMAELGRKFDPPISKSGVKHRLDKLADIYDSEYSAE